MSGGLSAEYWGDAAFSQAPGRVLFQRILGASTRHHPGDLVSIDDMRDKPMLPAQHHAGPQTTDIDKIGRSVGRYRDFNGAFLPTEGHARERWEEVYEAARSIRGFQAVDINQTGEASSVRDAHHRVSVLRRMGASLIQDAAAVVDRSVVMTSAAGKKDLSLKLGTAGFLPRRGPDRRRPGVRSGFSISSQYVKLVEHMAVRRHSLGLQKSWEINEAEAAGRRYDEVCQPVAQIDCRGGYLTRSRAAENARSASGSVSTSAVTGNGAARVYR